MILSASCESFADRIPKPGSIPRSRRDRSFVLQLRPRPRNGPVQIVSSFRALNDVFTMKRGTGSGVVTDWKQQGGTLLVSGDSRVIRVWDTHTENQILVCFYTFHSHVGSLIGA